MVRVRSLTIVACLGFATSAYAGDGDPAAGEKVFTKCKVCHQIGPGARNMIGPEQNGLDGRKTGSVAGYNYSDANKNSGIVWTAETFKKYIVDPKATIPGTKMIFPGLPNEKDRDDVWAYISQFKADGTKK